MSAYLSSKINALTESATLADADHALCDLLADIDCGDFSYNYYPTDFNHSGKALHVLCTQPVQGWQEYYSAQHYDKTDPIMQRMRLSYRPLGWVLREELAKSTQQSSPVLVDAMEFGFQGGFAVPIHAPQGGFANLVVQDIAILTTIQRHPEIEHTLQLAAYYYHAQVNQLLTREDVQTLQQLLTTREIECLRLTAQHKTAKEIARILNITPRTVSFHIENVLKKLHVTTKHQAVAKSRQILNFI